MSGEPRVGFGLLSKYSINAQEWHYDICFCVRIMQPDRRSDSEKKQALESKSRLTDRPVLLVPLPGYSLARLLAIKCWLLLAAVYTGCCEAFSLQCAAVLILVL